MFSENGGVAYCLLCWFCIVQNFWQAIKASLLWGVAPDRSSAICATASCSGFVWLTASILAWSRGGSPIKIAPARMPGVYAKRLCTMTSQPSIHSPSPRGRGLGIRQGCRDRTPKGFARTQSPQSVLIGIENSHYLIKNRLFLQTEKSLALRQDSSDCRKTPICKQVGVKFMPNYAFE